MRKPDKHLNCLKSVQSLPRWFVAESTRGHRRSFVFLSFYCVSLVSTFSLLCDYCRLISLDHACIVVLKQVWRICDIFWWKRVVVFNLSNVHLWCTSDMFVKLLIDLRLTRGHLIVRSLHRMCKYIHVNVPKIN